LPAAAFLELLRHGEVRFVVDVRTVPRSRSNPQFNTDELEVTLGAAGIGYGHLAQLGGLRGRSRTVAPDVNGFWDNQSFHNYADYALGEEFGAGLKALREIGRRARPAVMCAEAVWWRCHRRIIADYLIASGATVLHLLQPDRIERATLTPAARVQPDGHVTYPTM
jgi:uncharacterized protein (DUF488 family)